MKTHETVQRMCKQAADALQAGRADLALRVCAAAKGQKEPCEGLDLLRALTFMALRRPRDACEALKEELRYFPHNTAAHKLLQDLEREIAPLRPKSGDATFLRLYELIRPFTMIWPERLQALYEHAVEARRSGPQGNFVECGVAGGGSSALLAAVMQAEGNPEARLFCCDSFSGMPAPSRHDTHAGTDADAGGWGNGTCAAPESSVLDICARVGAADRVEIVKGYFCDTLPVWKERMAPVALLHMDGDWYEYTRDILLNLYDVLSPGAYVQVDDYGHWDGCRKAMHEFEQERGLSFALNRIDASGVWFVKP
jgi:hypothetical protein